eukprot:3009874-Prymnesium_polylepis.1
MLAVGGRYERHAGGGSTVWTACWRWGHSSPRRRRQRGGGYGSTWAPRAAPHRRPSGVARPWRRRGTGGRMPGGRRVRGGRGVEARWRGGWPGTNETRRGDTARGRECEVCGVCGVCGVCEVCAVTPVGEARGRKERGRRERGESERRALACAGGRSHVNAGSEPLAACS